MRISALSTSILTAAIFFNAEKATGGGNPAPPGDTIEGRLAKATSDLADVRTQLATAQSSLSALTTERENAVAARDALQGQFDALHTTAKETKDLLTKATADLLETNASLTTARASIVTKDSQIGNLESLCDIKGIDPEKAIVASITPLTPSATAKEWEDKLAVATTPADQAKVLADYEKAAAAGQVAK